MINKINDINSFNMTGNQFKSRVENGVSFSEYLKNAVNDVNTMQVDADNYKKLLATGQVDNLHDVMIASEKASIALQMTLSIRNKIVDAYQEIMRMQV